MEFKLDAIDEKILALLAKNSKVGNKEIAAHVGLTVTPTFERIRRLEKFGYISAYTIRVNKSLLGIGLRVFCHVSLREHNIALLEVFEQQVVGFEEVTACYHTAGDYDYTLLVEVKDMVAYEAFLKQKMASIPSISNVQSVFIMSSVKE